MGETGTITEAKGLYTFTSTEKIQMRYGVIAASWDEAKQLMDDGNLIKLNNGDHYGGDYMGESEPRRANLIRKTTCMGENFTMHRIAKVGWDSENKCDKTEHQYANVDHSNRIYIPNYDAYEEYQHDVDGELINPIAIKENGLCSVCNAMISRSGMQNWSMVPKREATHTTWGRLFIDEPKKLKTHPCGKQSVIFEGDEECEGSE